MAGFPIGPEICEECGKLRDTCHCGRLGGIDEAPAEQMIPYIGPGADILAPRTEAEEDAWAKAHDANVAAEQAERSEGLAASAPVPNVGGGEFVSTRAGFGYEKPMEGETNDWITPRWVLDPLGRFDLDPCASNSQPWACAEKDYRLGRGEDGLKLPWEGRVWCNPPYGRETGKWIQKMALHGNGVMLIFARVETSNWHKIWETADGILFFPKRVTFCRPDGTAASSGTAPSALVAWGKANVYALGFHSGVLIDHWFWQPDERKVGPDEMNRLLDMLAGKDEVEDGEAE